MQTPIGGSLTPEQLDFYNREGYLVLPHLLTRRRWRPAARRCTRKSSMIAGRAVCGRADRRTSWRTAPFETRLARLFANLTDKEFLRYGRSWRDRLPGYYHLMMNPKILDVVESLIGAGDLRQPGLQRAPQGAEGGGGHRAVAPGQELLARRERQPGHHGVDSAGRRDARERLSARHPAHARHARAELSQRDVQRHGLHRAGRRARDARHREIVPLPLAAGGAILFNDRFIHSSTANNSNHVRWSVDLRYQPVDQDPMPQHGAGFLARSRSRPGCVATLDDWLAGAGRSTPAEQVCPTMTTPRA